MEQTGLILLSMLPSAALIMLKLGVGVFSHPNLHHLHLSYRKLPIYLQRFLEILSILCLISGFAILMGFIDLTNSSIEIAKL